MAAIDGLPPLRDVIKRHQLSARKSLGQNFLLDLNLTTRIARAAGPLQDATVIEIGPGPGTLTAHLLTRCDRLVAIELDNALASALRARYAAEPRFHLIEGDVLRQNLGPFAPAIVCGNIPYYITVAGARAAVEAIRCLKAGELEVAPLQSYFRASF